MPTRKESFYLLVNSHRVAVSRAVVNAASLERVAEVQCACGWFAHAQTKVMAKRAHHGHVGALTTQWRKDNAARYARPEVVGKRAVDDGEPEPLHEMAQNR